MKFFKITSVKQITGCRNYCTRYPYVPWRNMEVLQSIEEELRNPPKTVIPQNEVKRISETNPANHTYSDISKFYTIPESHVKRYFQLGGIPKEFAELCRAFTETCLMVRKPFLEIKEYMEKANYSKLPIKYVLYGPIGSGKSLTLLHVLHYALLNEFILFHVPYAPYITKWGKKEAHRSETKPELINLPIEAATLLKNFQLQNGKLVEKLNLTTSKEYTWNLRESTPESTSLLQLAAHGINRVKYACDCLDALIYELKVAATNERCKVLFAIDGFNGLYADKTMIRIDDKYGIKSENISIIQSILKILQHDWCNGAIVLSISERSALPENRGSHLPFTLLRRKAFEQLDPFIPINVPQLTEQEFHSLLDYYEDRRWLQKPGGREEIEFVSSKIAQEVSRVCAPL